MAADDRWTSDRARWVSAWMNSSRYDGRSSSAIRPSRTRTRTSSGRTLAGTMLRASTNRSGSSLLRTLTWPKGVGDPLGRPGSGSRRRARWPGRSSRRSSRHRHGVAAGGRVDAEVVPQGRRHSRRGRSLAAAARARSCSPPAPWRGSTAAASSPRPWSPGVGARGRPVVAGQVRLDDAGELLETHGGVDEGVEPCKVGVTGEEPSRAITGRPWGKRSTVSGPRQVAYSPSKPSSCKAAGSKHARRSACPAPSRLGRSCHRGRSRRARSPNGLQTNS